MAFALRRPPNLSQKLVAFPYQLEAVRAVRDLPYAAIFHEQGLGKTKIAIDIVLEWLENDIVDTVFVVTKKSLVQNWMDEIGTHSYLSPRALTDNRRTNDLALNAPVLIYVLNYEACLGSQELIEIFLKTCRVGAILDESQKIKNPKTKLTACFLELSGFFKRRIIMTGTPIANRPQDIWSQIKFLDGGQALGESYQDFTHEVDIPNSRRGIEYGVTLADIGEKIQGFSIRETKATSGLELPDKTILSHKIALSPQQARIYENYRNHLRHEIQDDSGSYSDEAEAILKRLLRLVQCASNPILVDSTFSEEPAKYTALQKLLEARIFCEKEDTKVIIWTSFIDNARWLARSWPAHSRAVVHGKMSIDLRNSELRRFKAERNCKLLVATPGAAKEGLTLTVANHAIFYDRSFSLDDYLQAQDRIHRISQLENCFVHNLIAKETIDEWIDRLLYVKFTAAKIAHGDLPRTESGPLGEIDLSLMLSEVLGLQELV